jgi:hypothetical protein
VCDKVVEPPLDLIVGKHCTVLQLRDTVRWGLAPPRPAPSQLAEI